MAMMIAVGLSVDDMPKIAPGLLYDLVQLKYPTKSEDAENG